MVHHRGNRNSRGFTFLEIMVAVAIMSMVLVTLIGLKNRGMEDVLMAEHITTATMTAKDLMTDMVSSQSRMPMEEEGGFDAEELKDYTWKKLVTPTPISKIMEVRVAVFWKEGTRQEMVELVSYE
jgi:type II secretion system protein I